MSRDDSGEFFFINSKLVRLSPVLPDRLLVSGLAVPRSSIAVYLVPECQRLHGIIKCVVSADKMTFAPSEMISSSVNNLTVWYGKRAPISHRFHLFGCPSHCRPLHNFRYYHNLDPSLPLILFLSECDSFGVWQERSGQASPTSEVALSTVFPRSP
jgi:hypothetical protein